MQLSNKDKQILEHIAKYCYEVKLAMNEYGNNRNTFLSNPVYRNACSMPIMQIGELAKKLTPEFCHDTPHIPWQEIKGMRNLFAHDYHSMNLDMIWTTTSKNIPELSNEIHYILNHEDVLETSRRN